jgi:hypothetical protein
MDFLGVKSLVANGTALTPTSCGKEGENHAWNMVCIDDKWYHIDVTFDLTLKCKQIRYDYYLISDEEIFKDHNSMDRLPRTTAERMDYYYSHHLAVYNKRELVNLVIDGLAKRNKSFQFKLMNVRNGLDPSGTVSQIIAECLEKSCFYGASFSMNYNKSLWVFDVEIEQERSVRE